MTKPNGVVATTLLGLEDKLAGKFVFTGMPGLDQLVGGLRPGNSYLLAGLEKSGKTSLLLNWLSGFLKRKVKTTMLSTEMRLEELTVRLASIRGIKLDSKKTDAKVSLNQQMKENFNYIPIDEVIVEGGISVTKSAELVEKAIWDGSKVVIVDNLTTYGVQQTGTEATWIKVSVAITKLINLAKVNNVVIILVLHIKPQTTYLETPTGIKDMVKAGMEEKIFEESITIVKRPSLVDVYGGGGSLSQISGALLLWRPFQKFSIPRLQRKSMLILDSMRHSPSGSTLRLDYDGPTGKFNEDATLEQVEAIFT